MIGSLRRTEARKRTGKHVNLKFDGSLELADAHRRRQIMRHEVVVLSDVPGELPAVHLQLEEVDAGIFSEIEHSLDLQDRGGLGLRNGVAARGANDGKYRHAVANSQP